MTAASVAWVALAAALVLAPWGPSPAQRVGGRRRGRTAGHRGRAQPGADVRVGQDGARVERRRRALASAASAGLTLAGVAIGGLRIGLLCAVVVGPACVVLLRQAAKRPVAGAAPDRSVAVTLDLVAAALRSGRPLAAALALAGPAGTPDVDATLRRVAGLLRLGADPAQAWASVGPMGGQAGPLAGVAATAVRSATSGIKLAAAFERLAVEIRAECAASSAARAQRAGVHALAPLAACFLPSFVCLGVVPVIVGIASKALDLHP